MLLIPIPRRTLLAATLAVCFGVHLPASAAAVLPYVDYAHTNQRGDARYATLETNAGVRVLQGFLTLWTPRSPFVDAGQTAPAVDGFPAVVASDWTGIPMDATDGTILNASVLNRNVQYVADITASVTAEQATQAYLDDRRGKGYSVTDGLGPLTNAWRTLAGQTTTILSVPADATTVKYDDKGNNLGVGLSGGNTAFGAVVDFVGAMSNNGSTEPAKRYFKYARPWRWSNSVTVLPTLVPAKSSTAATDGGFISGHAAEATRDAVAMAYLVPERFQEMLTRGQELGLHRIVAGMHSPLDVIGGRIQAQAVVTANLYAKSASERQAIVSQARTALMNATGATSLSALNDLAHSADSSTDRFASHSTNLARYNEWMTFGFQPIAKTNKTAVVPKGAELLLETRFPYIGPDHRRYILKSTALPSGYPVMDDAEGWGRLNLFAAADGYGSFGSSNVAVNMNASLGGFHAKDSWRNNISGVGKLTKAGTGTLSLTGQNSFSGGVEIKGGTLETFSATALGTGTVTLTGGTLSQRASQALSLAGNFSQATKSTLQLQLGGGNQQGQLSIAGSAQFSGGAIKVSLVPGYSPAAGDTLALVTAANIAGAPASVTVQGFSKTQLIVDGQTIRVKLIS